MSTGSNLRSELRQEPLERSNHVARMRKIRQRNGEPTLAAEFNAYIGPHILGVEYKVDWDLAERFASAFGTGVIAGSRNVDLGACIAQTLEVAGLDPANICDEQISCFSQPERFFSYRASGGACGRHGALAIMEA